jgi:hypothetical protein
VSAIGWLIAAGGVVLLYLSLRPQAASVASVASKLGGSPGATTDLNPSAPIIVGIPKSILPTGYAECIASGGKWNYNGGDCVTAG